MPKKGNTQYAMKVILKKKYALSDSLRVDKKCDVWFNLVRVQSNWNNATPHHGNNILSVL